MTELNLDLVFPDPVRDEQHLWGRREELRKIKEAIPQRTVVVLGGRKLGKNSVLNVVAQWAESEGEFAVVRLAPVDSYRHMLAEVQRGIQQAAIGRASGADTSANTPAPHTVAALIGAIEALGSRLPDVTFLVCIDELDSLLNGCPEADAHQILALIMHLITYPNLPLRFLITMTRIPYHLRTSYRSPFHNQSSIVELLPWDSEQTRLFTEGQLDGRLTLRHEAHEALFRATGGHPYYTKAVLKELLGTRHSDPATPIPAAMVEQAVIAAAHSRDVREALTNLVSAHLPDNAATAIDRAANSSRGITARGVADLGLAGNELDVLVDNGVLTREGNRYLLRLGMWTQWQRPEPRTKRQDAPEGIGPMATMGWRVLRVFRSRPVRRALQVTFAALVVVLGVGLAFALPDDTRTFAGCQGSPAGFRVQVTHPTYVSLGDEQSLKVQIINDPGTGSVNGSLLFSFPDGNSQPEGTNHIDFRLPPQGQTGGTVSFISVPADARWLYDPRSTFPIELAIRANGESCSETLNLATAPLRHMQQVKNYAASLAVAVLLPLLFEWWLARRHRAREHTVGRQGGKPVRRGLSEK